MKTRMKHRKYSGHIQMEPDIAGIINKMQEQLVSLERKIDTLIGRPSQKPAEVKHFPRPFQRPAHTSSHGEARRDSSYRERIMHKAICADCRKECEVPFKPSGDRPVYCKVCFSKHKAGNPPPKERFDNRPGEAPRLRSGQASHPQAVHIDKPQGGEKKKHAEHKRPSAKRRKSRA